MKTPLFFLCVLLIATATTATPRVTFFNPMLFTAPSILTTEVSFAVERTFYQIQPLATQEIKVANQAKLSKDTPHHLTLTQQGINQTRIIVQSGETITWSNERRNVPAQLEGVQGFIFSSPQIKPKSTFSWTAGTPGRYVYVDTIVVGTHGVILVT